MEWDTWNQVTVPLSVMNLVSKTSNQIEIQKTDINACNAYVTEVEFGDGVPCLSKASTFTLPFFLLVVIIALI